jgi:hypothetical protein
VTSFVCMIRARSSFRSPSSHQMRTTSTPERRGRRVTPVILQGIRHRFVTVWAWIVRGRSRVA